MANNNDLLNYAGVVTLVGDIKDYVNEHGGKDEIAIQTTEPTEDDIKLWISPDDAGGQIIEYASAEDVETAFDNDTIIVDNKVVTLGGLTNYDAKVKELVKRGGGALERLQGTISAGDETVVFTSDYLKASYLTPVTYRIFSSLQGQTVDEVTSDTVNGTLTFKFPIAEVDVMYILEIYDAEI